IKSARLNEMDYVVAFWVNSTAVPEAELIDINTYVTPVTLEEQNTVGDWKLYTAVISPGDSSIFRLFNSEASTSMLIDELRLHPVGASFETYTHSPLCGVISKASNANYITYYDYDIFGRLYQTRDMRGNIVSK